MLASILQEAGYNSISPHLKTLENVLKLMVKIFPKNLYVILLILTSHFLKLMIFFLR
jgi:chemotaxis protein CheY-P-specific phosphatase CheC